MNDSYLNSHYGNIQESLLGEGGENRSCCKKFCDFFDWRKICDVALLITNMATLLFVFFIFMYVHGFYTDVKPKTELFLDSATDLINMVRVDYYNVSQNVDVILDRFVKSNNSSLWEDVKETIFLTNTVLSSIDGHIIMTELGEMTYDINKIASWVPGLLPLVSSSEHPE
jgi:hypothetical protein